MAPPAPPARAPDRRPGHCVPPAPAALVRASDASLD
eukprot:CAMPEP_0185198526 /NCGR_PEP_ID=MMETSP1140-20130426/43106_1 /TAXON_ID=298111 /ORGANISM="Pavlova sp., Strain CCMP459" /LENGTH=35 /DNA_ID= /DNA_START= /DNA_END= /DNA_ORIENTATION=